MLAFRESLRTIFCAGLAEVAPDLAIARRVTVVGNLLKIDSQEWDLSRGRLVVVGAGKAGAPMAQAVEKILGSFISQGFVVVKEGHALPLQKVAIGEASHPVPNAAGLAASRRIQDLANSLTSSDILLVLLSGGASALAPSPAFDLNLEDLRVLTSALLSCGATIAEINTIRRHLSGFGGGRLAKAANGATVIALIVSDVPGDNLADIASGPTAPDATTFGDCLHIIEKYGLAGNVPVKILNILESGARGFYQETAKPGDALFGRVHNFLLANNALALAACARQAAAMGFEPMVLDAPLEGEAVTAAKALCQQALDISDALPEDARPVCLLAGGETTVTFQRAGVGGRNQEMALTAALVLDNQPQIGVLFAGTDGTDGPTAAAGGFAFADTAGKIGKNAATFLTAHDSNRALTIANELFVTGPTLTNVMDLAIFLIYPKLNRKIRWDTKNRCA